MAEKAAGVVLCGGQSRRMGKPKVWLELDGEPLLVRAVRTLAACAEPLIVCAAPGQVLPEVPLPTLRLDDERPGQGPLSALVGALRMVEQLGLSASLVLGVDTPFFTTSMGRFLLERLEAEDEAVVPVIGGQAQPLTAAYRPRAAAAGEVLLAKGSFSMQSFLEHIRWRRVEPHEYAHLDPAGRLLENVNTPEAFRAVKSGGGRA